MKFGCSFSSKKDPSLVGFLGAVIAALAVGACTPTPTAREFKEANQDFGPQRKDGDINVAEIKMNALPLAESIRWKGDIETASWYRATDDLAWLSQKLSEPSLGHLSYRMRESVARAGVAWDHQVSNSAYASAAIGETRADSTAAVNEGVEMLTAQEPIIAKLLADRSAKTAWPKKPVSLVVLVEEIEKFLVGFVRDVERSGVDKAVKKQLVEELRINFGPKLQRIRAEAALAYGEKKTYDFVARVRRVLKAEGVNLGSEIESQLATAERLPREVERIRDAKSALSVLVDFWMASSTEVRETKFKTLAPDLYDFFSDQTNEELLCVKTGCGLFTRIKRALFILPKVEEFGIDKIRQQLAAAAEESIRSELEEQATAFLPELHLAVGEQINVEIRRQKTNITKIAKDYGNYLRVVLNRMAIAKLGLREKDGFAGAEPSRVRVDLDFAVSDATKKLTVLRVPGATFETGAAAIGSGLASAVQIHDFIAEKELASNGTNPIRARQQQARLFFEQINKALLIGGFKSESGKSFESFSMPLDRGANARANSNSRFNLRTMITGDRSFAVPDRLVLTKAARADQVVASSATKTTSYSVAGQAEMIRGLSRLAASLRDWEATPFDRILGPILVADFVPDLPRESVDQNLFPKDLFFAAAIGNAGAILQNMTRASTPVALIGPDRMIQWSNNMSSEEQPPEKMAVLATIFDIVNGVREQQTKTVDVARFLSSLAEFLRATEGIENTRSPVLISAGQNGKRPVDQLIEAKAQIRLLVMALGNFLWTEAIGSDGLVHPLYTRFEGLATGFSGTPTLLDQAIVIRAFLDASEAIKAAMFKTAALDLMSATTTAFFRAELGFFSEQVAVDEVPNLETLAAVLTAGERLQPLMTRERAAQWTIVSRPWINALRDAAETLP